MTFVLGSVVACGGGGPGGTAPVVAVDGSSTVFPIAEAVAEEYQLVDPAARVTVGVSGTGGGFKKFCAGETDISNASRPIRAVEMEACAAAGIEFIEVPIAYDGIAIVVHPDNDWVDTLTPDDLRRMWAPAAQGAITRWNQVKTE
ncbi:MAG: substrate-binding domain-containing protein, partial [Vicinamibacterales bacterium]|nr:substrate-binding domain-containing protein [Vicinamibacterales bacterium]